jgi:Uncharacterized protein conserved in bacteria (DUF2330)
MRRTLALLLLFAPFLALADGVVIRPTAIPTPVTIPDQRALIQYSNGTERLVIETRFSGAGTNFAWIVPLPAKPVIEEATPGIFSTLAFQLRPIVIHTYEPLFPLAVLAVAFLYLLLAVQRKKPFQPGDFAAVVVMGIAAGFYTSFLAIFLSLAMLLGVYRVRRGDETLGTLVVALVFAFLLCGLLLPAMSKGGAIGSTANDVNELERKTVGVFDVATVESKNPSALLDWLRENQFEPPPNASNAVADYVRRGWVFAVAKLHRDDASVATNAIHPLSFTFASAEPVYPMRLTGLGRQPLNVELFVFGSGRAEARNFTVQRCAAVEFPEKSTYNRRNLRPPESLPVMHPNLRPWLNGSEVVTRLTATLSPEQMQEDVALRLIPFERLQKTFYSRRGAAYTAADRVSGGVLGAFLLAAAVSFFRVDRIRALNRSVVVVSSLGLVALAAVYLALPQIPVRTATLPGLRSQMNLRRLYAETQEAWQKSPPATLEQARAAAAAVCRNLGAENLLLGGMIHEEESPGNYTIRYNDVTFTFVGFDSDGGELKL